MGWLFYTDRRVKTYADEKAEIARLCTFETDTRKTVLLAIDRVASFTDDSCAFDPVSAHLLNLGLLDTALPV